MVHNQNRESEALSQVMGGHMNTTAHLQTRRFERCVAVQKCSLHVFLLNKCNFEKTIKMCNLYSQIVYEMGLIPFNLTFLTAEAS